MLSKSLSLATFVLAIGLSFQQEECLLPREKGDAFCGEPGGLRFYFDLRTKHCQPFQYAGCNGNDNQFKTSAECKAKCSGVSADVADAANIRKMVVDVEKCEGGVRAAFDNSSKPVSCDKCPEGYKCVDKLCCPSRDAVCEINYDTGKYAFAGSHTPRYFYDKEVNNCLLFTYYGVLGNGNNFETYNECMKFCKKD
ncbi:unnamed protein product [Bursaphelenchus okinawaensis]|uniref:BPTI/Kunitz inhibitor domain-containing protein n=1 Tax=Bursaphelenchus okinawaensis TaxID=465554 RepID=A0A811KYR0_9BILA|nr:unnamed protein product [Bursaphelenchus okinawaensis]CAG9114027.1 unnamed protein product [Bursaphelenchus okinawaensis]